jgi:hypothetical protein
MPIDLMRGSLGGARDPESHCVAPLRQPHVFRLQKRRLQSQTFSSAVSIDEV